MSTDYIASCQTYTTGGNPPSSVSMSHEGWTAPRTKYRESIHGEEPGNSTNISPLVSHRITPTIHASLVSEVLNLRRQLESKDAFIDHLELTLQATKSETELLQVRLAASAGDVRSGQRKAVELQTQLEQVADGLVNERDSLAASNQELREKLDLVTKKSKDQEKEFTAWQQNWEAERHQWDKDRRQLERSLLLTEDRLRAVVDEFTSHHVQEPEQHMNVQGNLRDDGAFSEGGLGHTTDASSIHSSTTVKHSRPMSASSSSSHAWSVTVPASGGHGYTLADELGQEEEAEHGLNSSDDQHDEDILDRPRTKLDDLNTNSQVVGEFDAATGDLTSRVNEKSDGRTSVTIMPNTRRDSKTPVNTLDFEEAVRQQAEIMIAEILKKDVEDSVSVGSQKSSNSRPAYRSCDTQTDERHSGTTDKESVPLVVPSIAIHPPHTAPSTPKASVLPPATRSALCQTDAIITPLTLRPIRQTANAGVQTEDSLVADREVALSTSVPIERKSDPMHDDFHAEQKPPSHQSEGTLPPKPHLVRFQTAPADLGKNLRAIYLKTVNLPRPVLLPTPAQPERDATAAILLGRPSDELDQTGPISPLSFGEINARSDTDPFDFETPVSPPEDVFSPDPLVIRKAPISLVSFPTTVPRDGKASPHPDWRPIAPKTAPQDWKTEITFGESANPSRPQRSRSGSRETMASSFSASVRPPPIPIPARSSSRIYSDTLNHSLPTTARGDETPTGSRTSRQYSIKRPAGGVRKVQSATAVGVQKPPSTMKRRKSPSLAPIRGSVYENVGQTQFMLIDNPPIASKASTPINNIEHSIASSTFRDEHSEEEDLVDNTLVDVVASTMTGGWMWKYVNSAKNGDIRHKRWVWLSPYERTIMWSSKQPTTGGALVGTTGRKLQIKSVLDVKDDNPPPKGETSNTVFNRSIVVLTPSRALKLTALSLESHYNWLMALSFLTNPAGMPPQVPRVPELETYVAQNEVAQQLVTNTGTDKPYNQAQRRIFSEPTKTLSLKASLSRMVEHENPNIQPEFLQQDPFDQAEMRPLENYNRHARKRSNTGPSRYTPSVRSSRSIASLVSPALPSTTFPGTRQGPLAVPVTDGSVRPVTGMTSSRPGAVADEQSGTVRMTAFVDTVYRGSALHAPPPPPAQSFAPSDAVSPPPVMRSRRNSGLSTTTMERRRSGRVFDDDEGEGSFSRF